MRFGTRTVALVTILALHSGTSVLATPEPHRVPEFDGRDRRFHHPRRTTPARCRSPTRPDNSWSTGTRTSVGSHYRRILTAEPAILGRNYNQAVTGAKMAGLWRRCNRSNGRDVAYVTDSDRRERPMHPDGRRDDVGGRFPVSIRAGHGHALGRLPRARIYVVSIPDVLPTVGHLERRRPGPFGLADLRRMPIAAGAPALHRFLGRDAANDRATAQHRVQRAARGGVLDVHPLPLRSERLFSDPFQPEDVSRRDYFHPSLQGQRRLARGHVERELRLLGPDTSCYYRKHGCR